MIDLYVDDMTLREIQIRQDQQVLMFANKDKDEALAVPVSDEELRNIYDRVKMRCETLGLIPITNCGRCGNEHIQKNSKARQAQTSCCGRQMIYKADYDIYVCERCGEEKKIGKV